MDRWIIKPYRGLEEQISSAQPQEGELMLTTDTRRIFYAQDETSIQEISYLSSLPNKFTNLTQKNDLTGSDVFVIEDSEDNYTKKIATVSSILSEMTPSGIDGSIQYNKDGLFKGSENLVWNDTENSLNVTGNIIATSYTGIGTELTDLLSTEVYVDSTGFNNILSETDTTVQIALETLDAYVPLWTELGGNQSDINISGFNNDSGYITGIDSEDVTGALGYTPENIANKGQAGGYASLDDDALVPFDEIPTNTLGSWDASINDPTLANNPALHSPGDIYVTTVGGTQLGETFVVGDWVVFDGSAWVKSINTAKVISVNTQDGEVVLDTDDIMEGSTNKYFPGFTDLETDYNFIDGTNYEVPLTFSDGLERDYDNITNTDKGTTAVSLHESIFDHDQFLTSIDWNEIGGDQTDVVLSGFTNDLILDTDDVPEGNTFLYNQISDIDVSMYDYRIDIGSMAVGTNPSGYYKDLITNKKITHSSVGPNDTEIDGGIGFEEGRPFYWKNNRKQDVLIGIDIQEDIDKTIYYTPFESSFTFKIHSGDSRELDPNGIPLIQGYKNVSSGAYADYEIIDGGSF